MKKAYSISADEVFDLLGSGSSGLATREVSQLRQKYGFNELKHKVERPAWKLFLSQFKDFMILILAVAALLSGLIGEVLDAVIILVIILLNAVMSFVQEYRAERSMEALKKLSVTHTLVVRDGETIELPSPELLPGDLMLLEAGNLVPADARIVECFHLVVDESSLTGESLGVEKDHRIVLDPSTPVADRRNCVFKGTMILSGRAKCVVESIGMETELGKIAGMLQEDEVLTPLQQRMILFGKRLSYIILGICAVLFISGWMRGEDPFSLLLLSVSLAVAAIPEALPALITIALSKGASRLAHKKVLIRKLPAVETLGSVSFICSDKTGTLTLNRMEVVEEIDFSSEQKFDIYSFLQIGVTISNDVQRNGEGELLGESTETAMVRYAFDQYGSSVWSTLQQRFPRVSELPFDSDRKCMTTVHPYEGKYLVLTKGASESILKIISDPEQKLKVNDTSELWAKRGIRVLAFSFKVIDELPKEDVFTNLESDQQLAGLLGLMDPPRLEVKEAIAECRKAGITPVMITGDHPSTAASIAQQIGILGEGGQVLTGVQLEELNDEKFFSQVENIVVYARVSPEQKLRIIRALQKRGHYVAMTGDGVNDAPSLKAANIGVAMGINGTDVSKEAAHLILLDDTYAAIVNAICEGRRIFDNIRKFVKYIMTCNGAEIWTIFLAPLLGMPMPLLPIHILWINLVTDGLPAISLAGEAAEPDVMEKSPRSPKESLFSDGVGYHIVWVGLLMAAVTLFTQAYAIGNGMEHWQTMVITVLSLAQLGHVLAIRSDREFIFKRGLFSNRSLIFFVLFTFLLQLAVVYLPFFNFIFSTQPLSLNELAFCIGMSLIVFHAVELEKWIKRRWIKD